MEEDPSADSGSWISRGSCGTSSASLSIAPSASDLTILGPWDSREDAPRRSLYVPTELCELVIDLIAEEPAIILSELKQNRSTLTQCALVCRTWRPRAQYWLFRRVQIYDVPSLHRFAEILDASPTIGHNVREAALYCGIGGREFPADGIAELFPVVIAPRMSALRDLSMIGMSSRDLESDHEPEVSPHLAFQFPLLPHVQLDTVVRLHLESLTFPTVADFARLLLAFVNVEELVCEWIGWTIPGDILDDTALQAENPRRRYVDRLRNLSVRPPLRSFPLVVSPFATDPQPDHA